MKRSIWITGIVVVVILMIVGFSYHRHEKSEKIAIENYIKSAQSHIKDGKATAAFYSLYYALEKVKERRMKFTELFVPRINNFKNEADKVFLKASIETISEKIKEGDYEKAIKSSNPYDCSCFTECWELWEPPLKKPDEEFLAEQFFELERLKGEAIRLSAVEAKEILLPLVEFFIQRKSSDSALRLIDECYGRFERAGIEPSSRVNNLKAQAHKLKAEEKYNLMVTAFDSQEIVEAKASSRWYLHHMGKAGEVIPKKAQKLTFALSKLKECDE